MLSVGSARRSENHTELPGKPQTPRPPPETPHTADRIIHTQQKMQLKAWENSLCLLESVYVTFHLIYDSISTALDSQKYVIIHYCSSLNDLTAPGSVSGTVTNNKISSVTNIDRRMCVCFVSSTEVLFV